MTFRLPEGRMAQLANVKCLRLDYIRHQLFSSTFGWQKRNTLPMLNSVLSEAVPAFAPDITRNTASLILLRKLKQCRRLAEALFVILLESREQLQRVFVVDLSKHFRPIESKLVKSRDVVGDGSCRCKWRVGTKQDMTGLGKLL